MKSIFNILKDLNMYLIIYVMDILLMEIMRRWTFWNVRERSTSISF